MLVTSGGRAFIRAGGSLKSGLILLGAITRSANFNGILCWVVFSVQLWHLRPVWRSQQTEISVHQSRPRPEKVSLKIESFRDPSLGDMKVHIKFHRVVPTTPRSRALQARRESRSEELKVSPSPGFTTWSVWGKPTEVVAGGTMGTRGASARWLPERDWCYPARLWWQMGDISLEGFLSGFQAAFSPKDSQRISN